MLSQPTRPCDDSQNDTELECLLFLMATQQSRERQIAELQAELGPQPEPDLLDVLQTLLKGLLKSEPTRAA